MNPKIKFQSDLYIKAMYSLTGDVQEVTESMAKFAKNFQEFASKEAEAKPTKVRRAQSHQARIKEISQELF